MNRPSQAAYSGRTDAGVQAVSEALELLIEVDDPRVMLMAIQTLIFIYLEAGAAAEAAEVIARARPYLDLASAELDPLHRLRFDWLLARADLDLGHAGIARLGFEQVRRQYVRRRLPYEVALVSLDLAGAYACLGRRDDLDRLVVETMDLLSRLDVAHEAIATLALLTQARATEIGGLLAGVGEAVRLARRQRLRSESATFYPSGSVAGPWSASS